MAAPHCSKELGLKEKEETVSRTISFEELACPICLEIFIEPVTLVCGHELCKECYTCHFEHSQFKCPLCKKRLSSWARKAANENSLVNDQKWQFIKKNYPKQIRDRESGTSGSLIAPSKVILAEQGQVRNEYIKMKNNFDFELEKKRQEEEEASKAFIKQLLQKEMEEERQRQEQNNEELARIISEKIDAKVSPNSVSKLSLRSKSIKRSCIIKYPGKKKKLQAGNQNIDG